MLCRQNIRPFNLVQVNLIFSNMSAQHATACTGLEGFLVYTDGRSGPHQVLHRSGVLLIGAGFLFLFIGGSERSAEIIKRARRNHAKHELSLKGK